METEDKMRVRGPEAGQGLVKWRMTYFRGIDLQRFRDQLNKTIRNEQSPQCPASPKLEFGMTHLVLTGVPPAKWNTILNS